VSASLTAVTRLRTPLASRPALCARTNPRTVKRAISKNNARGPNINRATYKATITINILSEPR
jgi:hypothetical protein